MKVAVPNMPDKPEWKLALQLPLGLGRAEHAGQARVEAGGPDAEHHPRPHRHRQHSQGPDHGRAWNAARETETSARIHILKGCKQPGVLQHYARDSAEFAVQGERRTKKINCTFVLFP